MTNGHAGHFGTAFYHARRAEAAQPANLVPPLIKMTYLISQDGGPPLSFQKKSNYTYLQCNFQGVYPAPSSPGDITPPAAFPHRAEFLGTNSRAQAPIALSTDYKQDGKSSAPVCSQNAEDEGSVREYNLQVHGQFVLLASPPSHVGHQDNAEKSQD